MKVLRAERNLLLVRVDLGEEIVDSLVSVAREHGIRAATVTGLGAVRDTRLGYFDAEAREYRTRDFPGVLELVSFIGNLALFKGEPMLHAHVVVADEEFRCHGGHLMHATVAVTGEFSVRVATGPLLRRENERLGIKEQDIP
ncbi:MAG: DUF296 domain-containing protein [Planctomycetota bacterium]